MSTLTISDNQNNPLKSNIWLANIQGGYTITLCGNTLLTVIDDFFIDYAFLMIEIRLQEVCKKFNITNAYQFQKLTGFSPGMASRLWKGKWKSAYIDTLNTLCNLLDCTPSDILVFTKDKDKE